MKIMTVVGTRPELIRLSLIIPKLDRYCNHILVHTGQNYDHSLSTILLQDLGIRKPDVELGIKEASFGEQIGRLLVEGERILREERPDRILILGDTNSGLTSIVGRRLGIPVYHMEAGNRCFDDRVPEEVNRRLIDHSSTTLMPYTRNSKENLLREGIETNRVYVIGNPIYEVIETFSPDIESSRIHQKLKIQPKKYFLVTMHRQENVDIERRLRNIVSALDKIQKKFKLPVICSLHPRTKSRMKAFGISGENRNVRFLAPLGFFDFVALEKQSLCVITDSGTVQEECSILKVPNVTVRDVTERPETVETGSNIVAGNEPEEILHCTEIALSEATGWQIPEGYENKNVSSTVVKIILGI